MTDDAPICAIATPAGRGGIGVIRVSGRSLTTVINALCGRTLRPRHAHYLGFLDDDGSVIDRGIALNYPAPNSFTGEDVLELQGHGGPVILQLLLRRVLAAGQGIGLRLAEPGEFTRRAYLNEKLDLAQAEAVADLIDASTEQAARSAMRSLSGVFSDRIHALVERVINLRMLVEATLDFPEEEIDFLEAAQARPKLATIRDDLAALRRTAHQGALLRDGLNVVLAGAPNVGKSSLLNALAGAEVAIVTPIAGTTRDRVTQAIQIDGVPLNIIDTAGLRETVDEVERIGIERTWDALEKADVVVLLQAEEAGVGSAGRGADHAVGAGPDSALDGAPDAQRSGGGSSSADPAPSSLDQDIAQRVPAGTPVVVVRNKIDLLADGHARRDDRTVWLSARRGDGVELLRELLLELAGWQPGGESLFIARERHLVAIDAAAVHLGSAAEWAALGNAHLDLFAEELRLAQEQLNAVTGEFTADDLLGVIFSRFCIGK